MNRKTASAGILSPLLGPVTYPATMLAAFLYMWCAGEIKLALIQSMIGAAGTAVGWRADSAHSARRIFFAEYR